MTGTARLLLLMVCALVPLVARGNHDGTPLELDEFVQNEDCDMEVYMDSYNANKEMLLTKGQQCFDAIDAFRLHPYGPPTGYEMFNLMCKGICLDYYWTVRDVNTAGGCKCLPYSASETWARYVKREDPMCFKYPVEMFCDIMGGICEHHAYYHRHTCRGCGWEAEHEDQWREERDPDFGCGAVGVAPRWVIATIVAVVTLLMFVLV